MLQIKSWAVSKKTDTKWNSFTFFGTASQKCGKAPKKVEQLLKASHCSTICGTETRLQDMFNFFGSYSTFLGAVPQIVELFHKKWDCSTLCQSSRMLSNPDTDLCDHASVEGDIPE